MKISPITEREMLVFNKKVIGLTYEAIAKEMGITRERVRQVYEKTKIKIEHNEKVLFKLGRLEDIETELGIDLITLFKVVDNLRQRKGIYVKGYTSGTLRGSTEGEITLLEDQILSYKDTTNLEYKTCIYVNIYRKEITQIDNYTHRIIFFDNLSNYGKTWALTKEELKNE